jgi:hypothetical protein
MARGRPRGAARDERLNDGAPDGPLDRADVRLDTFRSEVPSSFRLRALILRPDDVIARVYS